MSSGNPAREEAQGRTSSAGLLSLIFVFCLLAVSAPRSMAADGDIDIPVTPLFQNDYPDLIDSSSSSIADEGCTLTAWTMLLNHEIEKAGLHTKNPDGTPGALIQYTPADINRLMNDYRVESKTYKKDANGKTVRDANGKPVVDSTKTLNGYGLTIGSDGKPTGTTTDVSIGGMLKAVEKDTKERSSEGVGLKQKNYIASGFGSTPGISKDGVIVDSAFTSILDQLKAGLPVVVRVANDTHTVLITSFHQTPGQPAGTGRYDIKDPARDPDGTSIPFLDDPSYGNRIFDFGTGVFQTGGLHLPYEVPGDTPIDPGLLFDPDVNPEQYGPQIFLANHTFIPEPSSLLMFGIGAPALIGLGGRQRKRAA